MQGAEIVVAGAGAVGRTIAWVLAGAGHRVTVVDPLKANASSVAAGMLAPAFECLFDAASAGRAALLTEARDLWPALAAEIGLPLACDGALAIGTRSEAEGWAAQLAAAGFRATLLAPAEAARCAPDLPGEAWAAFTPDDWRLAPATAMERLRRAAEAGGARFVCGRVRSFEAGRVEVEGAASLDAECLIAATGAGRDLVALAPELKALTPIKGHILRAKGDFSPAPSVRAPGVYLCRGDGEVILGATMETGRADPGVDPQVAAALFEAAAPLISPIAASSGPMRWSAAAGVRAATPDGLPLAGPSSRSGLVLAVGARRNGWLLAPLIARAVMDAVEGRTALGAGAAFDPRRVATKPG